jgi:hypothetical protein
MRTIEQIKAVLAKKNMVFFDKGRYNPNFIFERTSDTYTNRFGDPLHLIYKDDNDNEIITHLPFTTKSGLSNFCTGTLVAGQYRGAWQWMPNGRDDKTYPFDCGYMAQIKEMPIYLDGNLDKVIDKRVISKTNYRYQMHRMSKPNPTVNKTTFEWVKNLTVDNWSMGCFGAPCEVIDYIEPVITKAVALYGDKFTITLLESKDFE